MIACIFEICLLIYCFLTAPKDHGYRSCIDSVHRSLSLLQTSFIDLYLIHWPAASGKKPDDPVNSVLRQESWKALEHCYKNGLCKSIGVSNYCIKHLEEMKSYCETFPHVLQVWKKTKNICRMIRLICCVKPVVLFLFLIRWNTTLITCRIICCNTAGKTKFITKPTHPSEQQY